MKKFLTVILSVMIASSFLFGCKTRKVVQPGEIVSGYMMNTYSRVFTAVQFDSICHADKLAVDLEKWHKSSFIDFETGERVYVYMFIKEFSDVSELIYLVSPVGLDYKVTKRIVDDE